MLSVQRKNLILERLEREGSVSIPPLSEEFGVSEETIRRDLEKLEREGFAKRSYGGATFIGEQRVLPYPVRKKSNVAQKQKIAAAVANLIPNGASIMLDESSTALYVAHALLGKENITLITNSIETAITVRGGKGWNVLLTGGSLVGDVMALTGRRVDQFFREYHADFAVLSCTGLSKHAGITESTEETAVIKRAIIASAERVILAVDSRKFNRTAFASIGSLHDISVLVTDAAPSEAWAQALTDAAVTLVCE